MKYMTTVANVMSCFGGRRVGRGKMREILKSEVKLISDREPSVTANQVQ